MSRKGIHIVRHMMPERKHNPRLRHSLVLVDSFSIRDDKAVSADRIVMQELWHPGRPSELFARSMVSRGAL